MADPCTSTCFKCQKEFQHSNAWTAMYCQRCIDKMASAAAKQGKRTYAEQVKINQEEQLKIHRPRRGPPTPGRKQIH
jgi:hypothetical protein